MVSSAGWADANLHVQKLGECLRTGLWEQRKEEIFVAGVVDDFTADLDFIVPNNCVSSARVYNFGLQKFTLAIVK